MTDATQLGHGSLAHLNLIALGPEQEQETEEVEEQEQEPYLPFLTACERLGAKFQPVDDDKRCMVKEWQLSATPSLTVDEVLQRIEDQKAYCVIWPKDAAQRVVVFDIDDGNAMRAFESWDLPPTVQIATRKGVHHYFLIPEGIELPNIITESAMEKACYGKMGVFTRAKVIVGAGSWFKDKETDMDQQYALDDAELEPEFATLPLEMARALADLKPPTYADEADLAPACPTSDVIKHDLLAINEAAHKQNKPLITGNDDFLRCAFAFKWGLGSEMAMTLCKQWGGNTDNIHRRIWSLPVHTNQMGNLIALALEKGVDLSKLKLKTQNPKASPSKQDNDSAKQRVTSLGQPLTSFESTTEMVTDPVIKYFQPPNTTSAIVGPTGSMKTLLAMDGMRRIQEEFKDKHTACVLISNDMAEKQLKWYAGRLKLDKDRNLILPIQADCYLDLQTELDKVRAWGREKGIKTWPLFLIDTVVEFCRQVWPTIGLDFAFNPVKCAETPHFAHIRILEPIAEEFNCCLVGLEHNSRNMASRDNFPGHSKWEGGFTASVTRIYTDNRTQGHKLPPQIAQIFKGLSKEDEWRLASSIGKNRFNQPDFLFRFNGKKMLYDLVETVLDLQDTPAPEPAPLTAETYRRQLIEDLEQHPNQMFAHYKLMRISKIKPDSNTWVGFLHEIAKPLPKNMRVVDENRVVANDIPAIDGTPFDRGLYYDTYNKRHRVCLLR